MSKQTVAMPELSDEQPFVVEPAKPEDAEGVFNVQRLTWLDTYPNVAAGITEDDIRRRVEGSNGELIPTKIARWREGIENSGEKGAVYVVKSADRVIAFGSPRIEGGQRRVGGMYVLPEMQGKGLGGLLLQKAIEWHGRAEDIYLHVATYNQNAINFYKKHGFEETGNDAKDKVGQLGNGKEIPQIEMVLRHTSN